MIIAFLFVFIQSLLNFLPKAGVKILGYAANIPVESVLSLTNEKRKAAGLPELKLDPVLSQAAKNKGEDMLAKDYWAHISPDGVEPWKFFLDAGYQYRYAGENLARDFPMLLRRLKLGWLRLLIGIIYFPTGMKIRELPWLKVI